MSEKYSPGDKVKLVIKRQTDIGFVALVNGEDEGLLYNEEIFEHLDPGDELPGFIKQVRPDGKIDLILENLGVLGTPELAERIVTVLSENGGYLEINSKSPSSLVHEHFLVSRNKFKMALGYLYKNRRVEFTEKGTKLVGSTESSDS